jgi:hypothetical protein
MNVKDLMNSTVYKTYNNRLNLKDVPLKVCQTIDKITVTVRGVGVFMEKLFHFP